MKRWMLLGLVLLAVLAHVPSWATADDVEEQGLTVAQADGVMDENDHKLMPVDHNPFNQFDQTQSAAQCEKFYQSKMTKQALPVCRRAAEEGDAKAQVNLAFILIDRGRGEKKDAIEVVKWLKESAGQGLPMAQFAMGIISENGWGVTHDPEEAEKWFHIALMSCQKLVKQGDDDAQYTLAILYSEGWGVKKDDAQAMKWYLKAAHKGNVDAQNELGRKYTYGQGVKQDYAQAMKWYLKAANQGNARAQDLIGDKYFYGMGGVKQDYAKAVRWYRKAAEQGHESSQKSLGDMYSKGQGVKQDYEEAVKWYWKAVEQSNASAQLELGSMYATGHGVKKDGTEAVKWYRKAAEQGNVSAQYKLGLMFDAGYGVKRDYAKAAKWYRKAAERGHPSAQVNLGVKYEMGHGVKKNEAEAVKWYRKAAERGDASAQNNLAGMYSLGQGVMQSGGAAADWYYKAGLSYLREGKKEMALQTVERIKSLQSVLHLEVPNAFLANKLMAQIYGGNKSQPSPQHKQKMAQEKISGTGWPVTGGYVVTNHHVVAGRKNIILLRKDGMKIPASVVMDDSTNDLVLLKPKSGEHLPPALPLANGSAQVGEQVFTVGYPHPDMMGVEPKLTQGIINARTGMRNDPRVFQISVPLQGGNSGGPLLNMNGEVVGVTTAKLSAAKVFKWTGDLPQNVNYAVKVAYVQALLSSVDSTASVPVLPAKQASLADLAKRIEGSVLMVIAQ